jgi:beta-1,2-mannobiose phosphorylase / 1,2-beta-oligomannan phosphorylase
VNERLPYRLDRLGVVMEPDPEDPREAWGVLNPAAARGVDGELYLFPRLVAEGNYSRIGRARVRFEKGRPAGVERLGVVLEPREAWEAKGVEDPRITFVPRLGLYLMAYTGYGPEGPRVAIAASPDLARWERYGLARFGSALNAFANKDGTFLPEPVAGPDGRPAYALIHRPANEERPGIWISFAPADEVEQDPRSIVRPEGHRPVAYPEQPWEELKIGAGPPPMRTPEGWLLVYHGVSGKLVPGTDLQPSLRYSAGGLLLHPDEVWRVIARTREPLLEPEAVEEQMGIVPNVVFPTGLDERGEGTADVYYGMADSRIGVARLIRRREDPAAGSEGVQSGQPQGTSTRS